MSYSVGARGATKALALVALAAAFDEKVLPGQPMHAHDRDAHLASVERQLQLLPEPGDHQDVSVSMNGHLSWSHPVAIGEVPPAESFTSAGFGCSVSLVVKEAPKP
jgi:hypothetical protein